MILRHPVPEPLARPHRRHVPVRHVGARAL